MEERSKLGVGVYWGAAEAVCAEAMPDASAQSAATARVVDLMLGSSDFDGAWELCDLFGYTFCREDEGE